MNDQTPDAPNVSIHVLIDQFMADLVGAVVMFKDDDLPVHELIAAACPGESERLDLLEALVIKEWNSRLAACRGPMSTEVSPDVDEPISAAGGDAE